MSSSEEEYGSQSPQEEPSDSQKELEEDYYDEEDDDQGEESEEVKQPLGKPLIDSKKKQIKDFDGEIDINDDDYNDEFADEVDIDTNIVRKTIKVSNSDYRSTRETR